MKTEIEDRLEKEFNLPAEAIAEIAAARSAHDCHENAFGGTAIMDSPVCKFKAYKKHGVTFEQGEAIGWAYIHDMGAAQ